MPTPWYNAKSDGEGPSTGFNASNYYNNLRKRLGCVENVGSFKGLPASYVVFEDDSVYYAMNGVTGDCETDVAPSADAATVTQAILGALTVGRTWKEKTVLKGDLPFSTHVLVPNYTEIEIQGKCRLLSDVNKALFRNEHWGTATIDHDIEIHGGLLDGNKDNNAEAADGAIGMRGVYDVSVHDISIKDFEGFGGIYLAPYGAAQPRVRTNINNVNVQGCTGTGSYGAALYVTGTLCDFINISNIISYDNRIGLMLEDYASNINVDNVHIYDASRTGVLIPVGSHINLNNVFVVAATKNVIRYVDAAAVSYLTMNNVRGYGLSTFGSTDDGCLVDNTAVAKANITVDKCLFKDVGKTGNDWALRVQYVTDLKVTNSTLTGVTGLGLGNITGAKILGNDLSGSTVPISQANCANIIIECCSLAKIEHHTTDDALTIAECGTTHTNLGEDGAVTLTLPQSILAGIYFDFAVMAAFELRIDPGVAGAIYINGAKQTDDRYIWADDEGESIRLVADGNGDWVALYTQGTWGVE